MTEEMQDAAERLFLITNDESGELVEFAEAKDAAKTRAAELSKATPGAAFAVYQRLGAQTAKMQATWEATPA